MWSTVWTFSGFGFTVIREMYRQRNTSGVYGHFSEHGSKSILHKYNDLKYDNFGVIAV
jgi:hypothetical protein